MFNNLLLAPCVFGMTDTVAKHLPSCNTTRIALSALLQASATSRRTTTQCAVTMTCETASTGPVSSLPRCRRTPWHSSSSSCSSHSSQLGVQKAAEGSAAGKGRHVFNASVRHDQTPYANGTSLEMQGCRLSSCIVRLLYYIRVCGSFVQHQAVSR